MPRPFKFPFTTTPGNGLSDPAQQPGFGRGDHFRAFTAAEKIARIDYFTPARYNPAADLGPTPRSGSMDAFACPSRSGEVLHYRSGEFEYDPIPANPKPAYATY